MAVRFNDLNGLSDADLISCERRLDAELCRIEAAILDDTATPEMVARDREMCAEYNLVHQILLGRATMRAVAARSRG